MKNILSKKTSPLIIMVLLFAGIALSAWFGIVPFQKLIVKKADSIQQFHTEQENRERQLNNLSELQGQFDAIVAEQGALDILLPQSRIVDFVKTLEGLAQETQTEISIESTDNGNIQNKKDVKPAPKKLGTPAKEQTPVKAAPTIVDALPYDQYLQIRIKLRGEYVQVVEFLHKLENLPTGLDVIAVEMRTSSDSVEKDVVPASGVNPFLLSPALVPVAVGDGESGEGLEASLPPAALARAKLDAIFDTVVYVNKEE